MRWYYVFFISLMISMPLRTSDLDKEERTFLERFTNPDPGKSDENALERDTNIPESVPEDAEENIREPLHQGPEEVQPSTTHNVIEKENTENTSLEWIPRDFVVIKGLDKVTARVFSAHVRTNQKVRFGTLEIYVRKIFEKPPEESPEKISFIEIYDKPPGKQQNLVFSGWMFASNPALSALEHPVYDIWIEQN